MNFCILLNQQKLNKETIKLVSFIFFVLLGNISTAVDSITDSLKNFVDCVNALNDNNANVYNEFIKLVKIPTEDDINNIKNVAW